MTTNTTKLFRPLPLGPCPLQHRIVMAPMARFRADAHHVPTPVMADYYAQRACVPGTLLISEANLVSPRAGGQAFGPGIWTAAQLDGWRRVTDAVHARGCYIWAQLFALGRSASAAPAEADEGVDGFVSPSAMPVEEGGRAPRELREDEVWTFVGEFAEAARGAVERAGFDGVEIHGANGYLVDQFTQDSVNRRMDLWGGSVEKRARFAVEVAKAVAEAVGPERTGFRLSPWSTFQNMRMEDPVPQFTYLIKELRKLDLAYLHLVTSRISGDTNVEKNDPERLDFAIEAWGKFRPVLIAGSLKPEILAQLVDKEYAEYEVAAVFGRYFLSTPDLVFRIKRGVAPNPYQRKTFYGDGKRSLELGLTDYSYSGEYFSEVDEHLEISAEH